ncbi:MAG: 50S ribosomal protein L18 [Bacteroidetes bacterium]|nr:50S ribosomal protein L18 [Bacteroidota bacterium]
MSTKAKVERREKIKRSIASKVRGTEQKPRLVVFKSNKEIYAQIVDDSKSITLCAASSNEKDFKKSKETKTVTANQIGKRIAEKAKAAGISTVVFDRNGYLYHGRVKSLAEGAREGGLVF